MNRDPVEFKQSVRWWVVIAAIIVGWALTCVGPVAGQKIGADTVTFRKLVEFRLKNDYDHLVCVSARQDAKRDSIIVIDAILEYSIQPPCPLGTTGLLANSGPRLTAEQATAISTLILSRYPEFIVVCAMPGIDSLPIDSKRKVAVPIFWCLRRE